MKKKKKIQPESFDSDKPANQPVSRDYTESRYHVPVLMRETIEALNINQGGIYVDCTFGGGGHSKAILEELDDTGTLVAFDQDEAVKQNLPDDSRMIFVQQNFRHLARFLRLHDIRAVDGILADLGVSSHQFDKADRGFSTRFDAALDMRMDQRQSLTAYEVVQTYSEQQLHRMFEQYGEVTNSKTLAKTIVQVRSNASLKTIEGFRNAIRGAVKGNPNKYLAQVFQALRIEVNDELGALKEMLQQVPSLLKPGGRIAVISFHSLEDRLVKTFFRQGSFELAEENPFTTTEAVNELKIITRKPVTATGEEIKRNPRSRSAKLRVAEKK